MALSPAEAAKAENSTGWAKARLFNGPNKISACGSALFFAKNVTPETEYSGVRLAFKIFDFDTCISLEPSESTCRNNSAIFRFCASAKLLSFATWFRKRHKTRIRTTCRRTLCTKWRISLPSLYLRAGLLLVHHRSRPQKLSYDAKEPLESVMAAEAIPSHLLVKPVEKQRPLWRKGLPQRLT